MELKFEYITSKDGLSSSQVQNIFQDSRGFLWFGTTNGLNFYDGYQLKVYQHDPENKNSLSHNVINYVFEDKDGMLWIGTDNGLNVLNPLTQTFTRYMNNPDNPKSLGNNGVRMIHQDSSGMFWLGTYGGGLNKLNPKTGEFTRLSHDPRTPIQSVIPVLSPSLLIKITNPYYGLPLRVVD